MMIMYSDTNLGCFDFYAAYNQKNWASMERPMGGNDRIRMLSHFVHWVK